MTPGQQYVWQGSIQDPHTPTNYTWIFGGMGRISPKTPAHTCIMRHTPWENSLTSAFVHNTVTLDGQEFMLRAGRFLYLDWAQARIDNHLTKTESGIATMTAAHMGYRKIGVNHSRQVTAHSDGHWEVIDRLEGAPAPIHTARLHWLLPDWEYEIFSLNR